MPGFKKLVRAGLGVQVAVTLRVDVRLEVGTTSESITVTEAAPLLKTEGGEVSHNVATQTLNNLPSLMLTGAAAALEAPTAWEISGTRWPPSPLCSAITTILAAAAH